MLEWREDYSHVDRSDIEQGFKALDLHSIRIERHYTEECMENNRRAAEELKSLYGADSEAWLARCEQARLDTAEKITRLCGHLAEHFNLYQYHGKEVFSYSSKEWHLFFWCNSLRDTAGGKISGRDMSYVTLSFNESMDAGERFGVLEQVREWLSGYEEDGIQMTVQYSATVNRKFCVERAEEIISESAGKLVDTAYGRGRLSKVKGEYRFQKARARKHYYRLSPFEVCKAAVTV